MLNSYNIRYQPTGPILPKRWLSKDNITYCVDFTNFILDTQLSTHSF